MSDSGHPQDPSRLAEGGAQGPPSRLGRRVRLPLLLAGLAAAVLALFTNHSGISAAGGGSAAASPTWCEPVTPPPLQEVSWGQLQNLRASVLAVMGPLARYRYAWGTVPADVVWSDNSPERPSESETDLMWPASYEMRSWVVDPQLAPQPDDIVADVFLFADDAQAKRFFAEASATRCHRQGTERPAPGLPGASDLVWVNPDGPTQENVTVLRGPRVYRISDVRPAAASSKAAHEAGIARVNLLACALPDSGCPAPWSGRRVAR